MTILASKRVVLALALAGALLLIVAASRTWVSGTVDDAVLGASRVTGSGSQLAPGVVAVALAGAAAALVALTAGSVVRRVSVVLLAGAGLGAAALTGAVLLDPAGRLGDVAAHSTGRTGRVETHATTLGWPWMALAAAGLLVVASMLAWAGAARWQGLPARYGGSTPEPAAAGAPAASASPGARGQRVASAWDSLDAGLDPTEPEVQPPDGERREPRPDRRPER